MNMTDKQFYIKKLKELRESGKAGRLSGLYNDARIEALARHIAESARCTKRYRSYSKGKYDENILDPVLSGFDPLKAAVQHNRLGHIDEACWLVFLATHFGRHEKNHWSLARKIYSGGNTGHLWDWRAISTNPGAIRGWLLDNQQDLSGEKFGNHRKFQSLNPNKIGIAEASTSYVEWVLSFDGWQSFLARKRGENEKDLFRSLYKSMEVVKTFGRLGRFDYLTMLGNLEIIPVEADAFHLQGATGPLNGARLLFDNNRESKMSVKDVESGLSEMVKCLEVEIQVLEDALCNWQKKSSKNCTGDTSCHVAADTACCSLK